jgi:hypothetical protein
VSAQTAFIDGVAFWAPSLPGWDIARSAFRGETGAAWREAAKRPSPELLPAAERRRAPDTVAIALEVATRAVAASARAPGELLSVFSSAHGDLGITDYICAMLVSAPLLISPTKFHNSVHNAASGYWGIATGCLRASTAVSAYRASFAAGLLEALIQCAAEAQPVLLVGYDIAAVGPLMSTNDSRGLLAVALVLSPDRSERTQASLAWSLESGGGARQPLCSSAALGLPVNGMDDALPFFEALARDAGDAVALPLSEHLALQVRLDNR